MTTATMQSVGTLLTRDEVRRHCTPCDPLREVTEWIAEYMPQPHPELGRSGAVCPYTPRAFEVSSIRFAKVELPDDGVATLVRTVLEYQRQFLQMEPKTGDDAAYKAIVLVLPGLPEERVSPLIDEAHAQLKHHFTDVGMMLGQFYPGNMEGGLHNPDFKALQAPVPLLVLRWMTAADLPFLVDPKYPPALRVRYMQGYLSSIPQILSGPRDSRVRDWAAVLGDILVATGDLLAEPGAVEPRDSGSGRCPFAGV